LNPLAVAPDGRLTRRALSAAAAVLMIGAYLWLAPAACGGPLTYARVAGSSMEPVLRPGDLVFARKAGAYAMGDVVAYHNPDLGLVLHRIVVDNPERVIVKGDANAWVDSYEPAREDIAGKLWLRIPRGAVVLNLMRPPWGTLVLTLLLGLVVLLPTVVRRRRGRAAGSPKSGRRSAPWPRGSLTFYSPVGSVVGVAALVVALAGAASTVFAYSRPALEAQSTPHTYTQQAQFRYTAAAPPGLYDGPTIRESEPLFLRLTPSMQVSADYRVEGDVLGTPQGWVQLDATVRQVNGWTRTVPVAPRREFVGAQATASGTVDLRAFRKLIEEAEAATGVHFETYQLVITSTAQTVGGNGEQLHPFTAELAFRLSAAQLQIEQHPTDERNPLSVSSSGTLATQHFVPASVDVLGVALPVRALRLATPLMLLGSLALLGLLGRQTLRAVHEGEAARINVQYEGMIITAHVQYAGTSRTLVAVDSFADLAQRAAAAGLPVIRQAGNLAEYLVIAPEATYHYCVPLKARKEPPRTTELPSVPAQDAVALTEEGEKERATRLANIEAVIADGAANALQGLPLPATAQHAVDEKRVTVEAVQQKFDDTFVDGDVTVDSEQIDGELDAIAETAAQEPREETLEDEPANGYCMRCRQKRLMRQAGLVTMKNGRSAIMGTCEACGARMYRIAPAAHRTGRHVA
jgi:signal peptidase I